MLKTYQPVPLHKPLPNPRQTGGIPWRNEKDPSKE